MDYIQKVTKSPYFKELQPFKVCDGMKFAESPRWHNGKLYLSDMIGKTIWKIDGQTGAKEVFLEVMNQPNGSGFLSDGSFVYGSMFDQRLMIVRDLENPQPEVLCELKPLMTGYTGDMVIDAKDRIYIDDVGAKLHHGESLRSGRIIMVTPDGSEMRSVAEDVWFPNGCTISNDGKTFTLAESDGHCITQFDIKPNGSLCNRRKLFSTFDLIELGVSGDGLDTPKIDGICQDEEDGIWCSMFSARVFIRIDVDNVLTHMIRVDGEATTCIIGGEDGRTLYLGSNAVPKFHQEGESLWEEMNKGNSTATLYKVPAPLGRGLARP